MLHWLLVRLPEKLIPHVRQNLTHSLRNLVVMLLFLLMGDKLQFSKQQNQWQQRLHQLLRLLQHRYLKQRKQSVPEALLSLLHQLRV